MRNRSRTRRTIGETRIEEAAQMQSGIPREVGFLVYPSFTLLDLSGPLEAFRWAEQMKPTSYRISVMSLQGGEVTDTSGLRIITQPVNENSIDTLIVVGGSAARKAIPRDVLDYVRLTSARARRVASVCTGAFILAEAGLLDGRAATTHWQFAAKLQATYPAIQVDADRIFIGASGVWTSAGLTAGIDMALALIEEDLGSELARAIARILVVYYRRPGGQLQYSSLLENEPKPDRIRSALVFAREHLGEDLSVDRLAKVASLSVRQFSRAFRSATGMTPARAVERLRLEAARPRVEDGREPLETIARDVGFSDPARMRQGFIRIFGHTPQEVRRSARATTEKIEYRATQLPSSIGAV
jgi:transcriptional regulator GlxA family with amidase domain